MPGERRLWIVLAIARKAGILMVKEAAAKLDLFLSKILRDSGLSLTHKVATAPPGYVPELLVEFRGVDSSRLLDRNAELLFSLEHLATQVLRLQPEQHDWISFDVDGFKEGRRVALELAAREAVLKVRSTKKPFAFPPMSSRERRQLHLALHGSGLRTISVGEGPMRHLVLHPEFDLK